LNELDMDGNMVVQSTIGHLEMIIDVKRHLMEFN
jgi:hypothetical protein